MSESPWYKNPQGIVSAVTIVSLVLGFFYIREKQMWEVANKIQYLERRGDSAVLAVNTRLERVESFTGSIRDQVNFLEREIDRLKLKADEKEKRWQGQE